jgi:hypothetical protein
MTTGALIFALNNEQIDYLAMARWSAKNIERHLGIPTHIVTNEQVTTVGTNGRWFEDYGTNVVWHNESRVNAYELSPWDQTLVLDADYVVASDQLKVLLESGHDFLAHRWAYDVTGLNNFDGLNYFGQNNMPQWWATVMMFRRSNHARLIFESMTMIRDHWEHYKRVYKNRSPGYRNDHALSIALGIVNGHTNNYAGIPWNLASLTPEHTLTQLEQDSYRIDFKNQKQQSRWIQINRQDFHAMGKKHLGDIVASDT